MSTMIMRSRRALSAVMALGTLAAAGALHPAQAQESRLRLRAEDRNCKCVDRDGKEIEHCTCFRAPDVDAFVTGMYSTRGMPRARLGITLSSRDVDASSTKGAVVQSVVEDGPADQAGLRKGDVLTALDGVSLLQPLDREREEDLDVEGLAPMQRLLELVRDLEPGQEVRVDYLRDGKAGSTTVKAGKADDWNVSIVSPRWHSDPGEMTEAMENMRERLRELRYLDEAPRVLEVRPDAPGATVRIRSPEAFVRRSSECPDGGGAGRGMAYFSTRCVAGVAVEELNPKLGEYFGTAEGVLVTDVNEDSTLGLQPGDVILDVGGRKATDPDRLRRILSSYGDDEPITLRIMRQKREMSVQGTLGN